MVLKHFRKYKFLEADVKRVLGHLKLHGKITANDIITRPLRKPRKKGGKMIHDEPIPWILAGALKASFQDPKLASGPNGRHQLYGKEDETWKLIVPAEGVTEYMRQKLLDPGSRMPLSRDSAHYHLMKTTIGISRRSAYAFLEKQSVLQITRNIPNERDKGGEPLYTRGSAEMDLIEGQGRDVTKHLKTRMDGWYWLAVVDRLTGYGVVEMVQDARGAASKQSKWVAEALKEALKRLEHALGAKVNTMHADHGREFFSHVKKFLVGRNVKLKQVQRGSRVEKFNADFQRTFYRLARLKRGSFSQIEQQTEEITNNLKNKYTKLSPADAVKRPDRELAAKFNTGRKPKKPYKGKQPQIGDKCRVLLKMRKNIRPTLTIKGQGRMYKSYHARHFQKGVHKIQRRIQINKKKEEADEEKRAVPLSKEEKEERKVYRYYVNGRWVDRDEILLISGTDLETDRRVAARKR